MNISVAHICHGHDGVGVGVRGAAAFWLWNQVQASHWQTTSLMALFMPGQKKLPCMSKCDSLLPDQIDAVDVGLSPFQQWE